MEARDNWYDRRSPLCRTNIPFPFFTFMQYISLSFQVILTCNPYARIKVRLKGLCWCNTLKQHWFITKKTIMYFFLKYGFINFHQIKMREMNPMFRQEGRGTKYLIAKFEIDHFDKHSFIPIIKTYDTGLTVLRLKVNSLSGNKIHFVRILLP